MFGRSLFTVSFFGANVYPENVAVGLEQPAVSEWVTGKFVLQTVADDDENADAAGRRVELAPGRTRRPGASSPSRSGPSCCRLNSEFAHYVPAERQLPQVVLRPAGDPEYFPVGVKHRYTRPG